MRRLLVIAFLSVARFSIQPRIDVLFAEAGEGRPDEDAAAQIRVLRVRRKRMASVCTFCVLAAAMLGAQASVPFPPWLTVAFFLAIPAFTWRTYASETAYGWV